MIVDLLVGVVFGVLNAILSLIPDWTLPEVVSATDGAQDDDLPTFIAGYLTVWNAWWPVQYMFTLILTIVAARLFVAVVQFLRWLWSSLPFKAS